MAAATVRVGGVTKEQMAYVQKVRAQVDRFDASLTIDRILAARDRLDRAQGVPNAMRGAVDMAVRCDYCGGHHFSRKDTCTNCGAPKPCPS